MNDIDELLTPRVENAPATDGAIWHSTTRVLRHRRWARYARRGAVMIAFFAAGAATMRWTANEQSAAPMIVAAPPAPEPTTNEQPVDPYRNDSPKSLERWASLADGDRRSTLYRRAGDGYLERGNELAAIRCYKSALNGVADLAVRPEHDTWLMMSMKLARQKENSDARN